jgi:hypothetical protein
MSRTEGLYCPNELEVEIDLAGGGRHTSVRNALHGSVDEGGSRSIWIQIDDVNPVALRGMRVHQSAGKNPSSIDHLSSDPKGQYSPCIALVYPDLPWT